MIASTPIAIQIGALIVLSLAVICLILLIVVMLIEVRKR